MGDDEPIQHYVLVSQLGKQPGRRNHKSLALQLAAIDITAQGFGGGLVKLLLPSSEQQFVQLVKLVKRGYWYRLVRIRRTIRRDIREAAVADELLVNLLDLFLVEKKGSKYTTTAVVEEFSKWLGDKLARNDRRVKRLVSRGHYELPNRVSSDWWKKQINQNVKRLKK
jgi:hypothetical protein